MIVRYINSFGETAEFQGANAKLREADFYHYSWELEENGNQWKKEPKEYKATIEITGNGNEKKKRLNRFMEVAEKDICAKKKGKLYFGNQYLKCVVRESEEKPAESPIGVTKTIIIYTDEPLWITEETFSVRSYTSTEAVENAKGYPYGYPYGYAKTRQTNDFYIDHYTDSDFRMIVYGPVARVQINIAGHPYIVEHPILEGEYMVIDSRDNLEIGEQLYLVKNNGEKENLFNYRGTEYSVFKKLPFGNVSVDSGQDYGFDLTVFLGRSTPKYETNSV